MIGKKVSFDYGFFKTKTGEGIVVCKVKKRNSDYFIITDNGALYCIRCDRIWFSHQ